MRQAILAFTSLILFSAASIADEQDFVVRPGRSQLIENIGATGQTSVIVKADTARGAHGLVLQVHDRFGQRIPAAVNNAERYAGASNQTYAVVWYARLGSGPFTVSIFNSGREAVSCVVTVP